MKDPPGWERGIKSRRDIRYTEQLRVKIQFVLQCYISLNLLRTFPGYLGQCYVYWVSHFTQDIRISSIYCTLISIKHSVHTTRTIVETLLLLHMQVDSGNFKVTYIQYIVARETPVSKLSTSVSAWYFHPRYVDCKSLANKLHSRSSYSNGHHYIADFYAFNIKKLKVIDNLQKYTKLPT